jgi:hypothetical protein
MTYKRGCTLFATAFMLLVPILGHCDPAEPIAAPAGLPPRLTLVAKFMQPKFQVGTEILLQAVIKNDGTENQYLTEEGTATKDFTITVTDSTGRPVPTTRWGKKQESSAHAPQTMPLMVLNRMVPAGKSVTYQFVLNRQFDMSETGTYHVELTRPGVFETKGCPLGTLVADTVDVVLTEPAPDVEAPQDVMQMHW